MPNARCTLIQWIEFILVECNIVALCVYKLAFFVLFSYIWCSVSWDEVRKAWYPENAFFAANTTFIVLFVFDSHRCCCCSFFVCSYKKRFHQSLNIQFHSALFSFTLCCMKLVQIITISCIIFLLFSVVWVLRRMFSTTVFMWFLFIAIPFFFSPFIRLIPICSLMAIRTSSQRISGLKNERFAITITFRECIYSGPIDHGRWFSLFFFFFLYSSCCTCDGNHFEIGPYKILRQYRFSTKIGIVWCLRKTEKHSNHI